VSGALQGPLYAFVLVSALSLLMLLMLWRMRESLLALLPLVLALAWTIGRMHLFGIRFHLANIEVDSQLQRFVQSQRILFGLV
jgi:predicted RND superfamily exporter protein